MPPTVLTSFNGTTNGANPYGSLIMDAAGNLFGTTNQGGANGKGTVFEIVKTGSGYSGSPTVLVSFNGANGSQPSFGSLIMDAAGNLYGVTAYGGTTEGSIHLPHPLQGAILGRWLRFPSARRSSTIPHSSTPPTRTGRTQGGGPAPAACEA